MLHDSWLSSLIHEKRWDASEIQCAQANYKFSRFRSEQNALGHTGWDNLFVLILSVRRSIFFSRCRWIRALFLSFDQRWYRHWDALQLHQQWMQHIFHRHSCSHRERKKNWSGDKKMLIRKYAHCFRPCWRIFQYTKVNAKTSKWEMWNSFPCLMRMYECNVHTYAEWNGI